MLQVNEPSADGGVQNIVPTYAGLIFGQLFGATGVAELSVYLDLVCISLVDDLLHSSRDKDVALLVHQISVVSVAAVRLNNRKCGY